MTQPLPLSQPPYGYMKSPENKKKPIIDRETFEQVQERIAKTKRRAPKEKNGKKSIFADLLYCGDCHRKMWYRTNTINRDIHFFVCSDNEKDYRGNCKGRHYVREDALEQVVKLELRKMAEFLKDDEEAFAELLAQKANKDLLAQQKFIEGELKKAAARSKTVSGLYQRLYEDNACGKVSDEWFMQLSHKYETERMELKAKISEYRKRLSEMNEQRKDREAFVSAVRRFMRMERLTAPILRELINHIDVYETEGTGTGRTQRIVIYYRFVGYLKLPQEPTYTAETRQGVAIFYLPTKSA